MGILNKMVKETKKAILKKQQPGSVAEAMFVPVGLSLLDYQCGTMATNLENGENFYNIGIPMGKVHMAVGHSQSGKTTLLLQVADKMTRDLNGDVVLADFERSSTDPRSRIKNICGITDDEYDERFTIFNHEDMTAEFLKKFIFEIVDQKRALGKDDLVDWFDLEGREIKIYPPTVLIIDSVSAMRSKELLENKELDNNMVAAQIAKSNGAFLTSIEHFLEAYNITILAVGHIGTKIVTNAYAPRKVQLPGLGDDESISGGNKFIFMSSYLFKLTAGKEFKEDKDLGIQGRVVNLRILKSRSGYNAVTLPMVYHSKLGFHDAFTSFYWFKENDVLKGGGSKGYHLPGDEGTRYSQKDFIKVYKNDEEFRERFDALVTEKFGAVIDSKNVEGAFSSSDGESGNMEEEFED
jgi:KaiC/GvpD/RAD55 family RecA-like ATPase